MKIYLAGERDLKSNPWMKLINNRLMTYFYHGIGGGNKRRFKKLDEVKI